MMSTGVCCTGKMCLVCLFFFVIIMIIMKDYFVLSTVALLAQTSAWSSSFLSFLRVYRRIRGEPTVNSLGDVKRSRHYNNNYNGSVQVYTTPRICLSQTCKCTTPILFFWFCFFIYRMLLHELEMFC